MRRLKPFAPRALELNLGKSSSSWEGVKSPVPVIVVDFVRSIAELR